MAKNVGKTVCLNHLLARLWEEGKRVALTSIGLDGERTDQLLGTPKPEITLRPGAIFATTERHYRQRQFVAEILDVSDRQTALGRLVTARAITPGKVILSGAPDTRSMGRWIDDAAALGAEITLVEGALSRLSLASPTVAEGIILATGAALSESIPRLVRETRRVYDLMQLPPVDEPARRALAGIEQGLWAVDDDGRARDLNLPSAFLIAGHKEEILARGNTLFAAGAVTDALLQFLRVQRSPGGITLVARDFTRIFARGDTCRAFLEAGGQLRVLLPATLLAVCANPLSPTGFLMNSDELTAALRETLRVPVYDIKRIDETCYSKTR
jgi:hypothetical protein